MTNQDLNFLILQWGREFAKAEKIEKLRESFMNCTSTSEVSKVVKENFEFMNRFPETFRMAKRARRRIGFIRSEQFKSWKSLLN
jgi:hypothetical protein